MMAWVCYIRYIPLLYINPGKSQRVPYRGTSTAMNQHKGMVGIADAMASTGRFLGWEKQQVVPGYSWDDEQK